MTLETTIVRALPSFAAPSEPRRTTLSSPAKASASPNALRSSRTRGGSAPRRNRARAHSPRQRRRQMVSSAGRAAQWSVELPAAPSIAPRAVGHQPATTPHSRPPPRQAARPRFRTTASHHLVYLPLRQRETAHVYERREGPSRREQLLQGSPLLILFAVVRPSHPGRDHGKRRYRYFQEMARRPRARAT